MAGLAVVAPDLPGLRWLGEEELGRAVRAGLGRVVRRRARGARGGSGATRRAPRERSARGGRALQRRGPARGARPRMGLLGSPACPSCPAAASSSSAAPASSARTSSTSCSTSRCARSSSSTTSSAAAAGNLEAVERRSRGSRSSRARSSIAQLLAELMRGRDYVFHLAALWLYECVHEPRQALEVNVVGTYNVVEAAQDGGRQEGRLLLVGVGLRRRGRDPDDRGPPVQQPHDVRRDEDRRRAVLPRVQRAARARLRRPALHERLRAAHGLQGHVRQRDHEGARPDRRGRAAGHLRRRLAGLRLRPRRATSRARTSSR